MRETCEKAGLFRATSRIGFLREWLLTLHDAGVSIRSEHSAKPPSPNFTTSIARATAWNAIRFRNDSRAA